MTSASSSSIAVFVSKGYANLLVLKNITIQTRLDNMPKKRRRPLPQQEVIATITGLSHDGRGVAQINGKTTFLFGGLPGESVHFRYTKQRASYDEGQVTQVDNPSPQRVEPSCPYFGLCGGCSLQHLTPNAQLEYKQNAFLELLQHQAGIVPKTLLKPLTGDLWGYRRKARLSVKAIPKKEKQVLVGFRERNGRYVADINHCEILHPSIGQRLLELSQLINQLTARNEIPQLEIAVDDHTTAIILRHLRPLDEKDLEILEQFFKQHDLKLYLQPAGPDSIHLHYPNSSELLSYQLPRSDITLQFHPHQFIQINASINQQMIDQALALLDLKPTDRALDLFCGIGNFTLPIAKQSLHVVGVEGDPLSVNQALSNAKLNNITNVQFYCANLFQETYNSPWAKQKFNKLLLDPPRAGAKEILDIVPTWKPERIVYVSCNPATLARDAKILVDQGYRLTMAGLMDMFPHTQHVEVMALFVKNYQSI